MRIAIKRLLVFGCGFATPFILAAVALFLLSLKPFWDIQAKLGEISGSNWVKLYVVDKMKSVWIADEQMQINAAVARAQIGEDEISEAIRDLSEIIATGSSEIQVQALMRRSEIYSRLGDYSEAVVDAKKALSIYLAADLKANFEIGDEAFFNERIDKLKDLATKQEAMGAPIGTKVNRQNNSP